MPVSVLIPKSQYDSPEKTKESPAAPPAVQPKRNGMFSPSPERKQRVCRKLFDEDTPASTNNL